MTTGERIKLRRKELGMNAETVAERIGVSVATMYRYEKGDIEKVPSETLVALALVLHTTPAYLMGWEDLAEKEPTAQGGELSDDIKDLVELFQKAPAAYRAAALAVLRSAESDSKAPDAE